MATTLSDSELGERRDVPQVPDLPSRGARIRTALRAMAVVLLALALGYGAGRGHAFFHSRTMEGEFEAALEAQRRALLKDDAEQAVQLEQAQALVAKTQLERDRLFELATMQEGYRKARQALTALDARNFGIAQARVREAERLLTSSSQQAVAPVIERLAATDVTVAGNLAEQRRALAAIIESLDGVLAVAAEDLALLEVPAADEQAAPPLEPALEAQNPASP